MNDLDDTADVIAGIGQTAGTGRRIDRLFGKPGHGLAGLVHDIALFGNLLGQIVDRGVEILGAEIHLLGHLTAQGVRLLQGGAQLIESGGDAVHALIEQILIQRSIKYLIFVIGDLLGHDP